MGVFQCLETIKDFLNLLTHCLLMEYKWNHFKAPSSSGFWSFVLTSLQVSENRGYLFSCPSATAHALLQSEL